jgi:hypothetical protein
MAGDANGYEQTTTQKNEIDLTGMIWAGILFILFILAPIFFLIALWPDRLPLKEGYSYYDVRLFQVILLDKAPDVASSIMHLNTLLMILVAVSGFMGTMIHAATSFTNFVGSEKFKRSWTLWYYVKPFIGAAMAMVFYFVFRAGLLNFNDPSNINLFGLITLAALTGLFTDRATIKLEEFFDVVFKPKDERPGKLETKYKFTSITPQSLDLDKENTWVISGEHLDEQKFKVLLNDNEVPFAQTAASITITYTPTEEDKKLEEFKLVVIDEDNKEAYSAVLRSGASAEDTHEPDDDSVG